MPKASRTQDADSGADVRRGAGERSLRGVPILVVDEVELDAKLARLLLASEGAEVRTTPDSDNALAAMVSLHPRLILIEVQMRHTDGLQFTRVVKSKSRMDQSAVVVVTSDAGCEYAARRAGCDGFITKPIDVETFAATVASYLPVSRSASS